MQLYKKKEHICHFIPLELRIAASVGSLYVTMVLGFLFNLFLFYIFDMDKKAPLTLSAFNSTLVTNLSALFLHQNEKQLELKKRLLENCICHDECF